MIVDSSGTQGSALVPRLRESRQTTLAAYGLTGCPPAKPIHVAWRRMEPKD